MKQVGKGDLEKSIEDIKTDIASVENQMNFMNLHDVFLNAMLQRKYMYKSPLVKGDAADFTISDRGRFERTWIAFLYVLVEAWKSREMKDTRSFLASLTSLASLNKLISEGESDGKLKNMAQVRHYMCHRDKRKYWDEGRAAVCQLDFNESLYQEFSKVFLGVFKALKKTSSEK